MLVAIAIVASSCNSLSSVSNGGYSDVSLNKNSNEYELKRLNEISVQGKAILGVPMRTNKRQGVIVRFNGVELGKSSQVLPIITMLAYSLGTGYAINEIVGTGTNGDDKFGILPSIGIGLPVAGALNNLTWSRAALRNAAWDVNTRLVEENPGIDIFLNPKYEISYKHGVFWQNAEVKANVMGATIKTD